LLAIDSEIAERKLFESDIRLAALESSELFALVPILLALDRPNGQSIND
jgi:hypothetical protein